MKKILTLAIHIILAILGGICIIAIALGDGNIGLLDL